MLDYFHNLIANCASKWRPVVGYEGLYEVSMDGEVRSIERVVPHPCMPNGQTIRSKVLKKIPFNKFYRVVSLCRSGSYKTHFIHRLVVEANIGPVPPGMDVDHISGQRDDNRLANLRIATRLQNARNKVGSRGACGYRGLSYRPKQVNKWSVRMTIDGSHIQIGSFPTREAAISARLAAELKYWGDDAPAVVRK